MDITINAKVSCSDGPCGRATRVIVKPTTEAITHLVINNEFYPATEYLVPIEQVIESTHEQIKLSCNADEFSKMPIFDQIQFIPADFAGYTAGSYLMWPYFLATTSNITLELEHIPEDELDLNRGAGIQAQDGYVGRLDEFLFDPEHNNHITHIVMREGHLWGQKEVTIPVGQIDHYENNTVYLKLNKQDIEKLPSIPIRHSWAKKV